MGRWKLKRAGFRHVVSLRQEFNDAERNLTLEGYCYLPTADEAAPSIEQLREGVEYIRRAVERGEKVYIHCEAGRGRSPAMAAAYFISQGASVQEAVEMIYKARRSTTITAAQRKQLEAFKQTLES
jgi:protein-tyrosine phosphatase